MSWKIYKSEGYKKQRLKTSKNIRKPEKYAGLAVKSGEQKHLCHILIPW